MVSGKWFLGSGFWEVVSGKFLGTGFWGLVSGNPRHPKGSEALSKTKTGPKEVKPSQHIVLILLPSEDAVQ